MQKKPYFILENAIRGKKNLYTLDMEPYVTNPLFIQLLTIRNSLNSETNFRLTDILNDITNKATWSESTLPAQEINPQKHDYIEIAYIKQGVLPIRIEQEEFTFSAGSAYSLDINTANTLQKGDYEAIFLGLSRNFFKLWPLNYEAKSYEKSRIMNHINKNLDQHFSQHGLLLFNKRADSRLEEVIGQLQKELSEKQNGYSMILYGLVFRILMLLENPEYFDLQYINLDRRSDKKIANEIHAYLINHPYRMNRSELACELHYSEEYIGKLYKQVTGESIQSANRRIYLEEAQQLLVSTDLTVTRICKRLHFRERKSFYDVFAQSFGCTPRQYRLAHKVEL